MKKLKKINYFICGILLIYIALAVTSFTSQIISNDILAYLFDIFILFEVYFIIEEFVKEEEKNSNQLLQLSKNIYSLDFSNLENIKDLNFRENKLYVTLKNNIELYVKKIPFTQDELIMLDKSLKIKK